MINVKEVLTGDISVKEALAGEINNGVKVISPSLIDLEVTPSKEKQTFNHEGSYGYDNIVVNPMPEITLETKVVTPTKEVQTVVASENYDGLSEVTVDAIPDDYIVPTGTITITENGTHNVREYENIVTDIHDIPDGYIVPSGEIEITESGTYDVTEYASANVNVSGGSGGIGYPVFTGVVPVYEGSGVTSWRISNYNVIPSGYSKTDKCILIAFVRSDYTLSDNLTLIAETDWFTSSGTNQKTIVAIADLSDPLGTTEITQASSGRMEVMMCHFMDIGEPTVILNETNASGKEFKTATDDYFNLYAFSKVTMAPSTYQSKDFDYFKYGTRLAFCWSDSASASKTINIDLNNTAFGIIGIRIPRK